MAGETLSGNNNSPKTYEELQKEINYLTQLLKAAYTEILELKKTLAEYEQLPDEYNKKWTWITKIAFTITKAGLPLRSSEIIDTLLQFEPALKGKNDVQKFFSGILNTGIKHGRFVTHKLKGVRGYFYCLPEWLDNDGELKQEFKKRIF